MKFCCSVCNAITHKLKPRLVLATHVYVNAVLALSKAQQSNWCCRWTHCHRVWLIWTNVLMSVVLR